MSIKIYLWLLWFSILFSMILKWELNIYMTVVLIILPILTVLLDIQEQVYTLQQELNHQRKYVLDRIKHFSEQLQELKNIHKQTPVVDFAEFAKDHIDKQEPKNDSENSNSSSDSQNPIFHSFDDNDEDDDAIKNS